MDLKLILFNKYLQLYIKVMIFHPVSFRLSVSCKIGIQIKLVFLLFIVKIINKFFIFAPALA